MFLCANRSCTTIGAALPFAFMTPRPVPAHASPPFDHDALLLACAAGDRAALQSLYRQEGGWLLGVALRIVRERGAAEDVLHDAFVRIWTQAARFDPARGEGRGWICSIVRNMALNHVRDGARVVTLDELATEAIEDDTALAAHRDSADPFETRSDLGRLRTCLEQLRPERRDCIVFAYLDGCSHREIAERMDAPLGTVKAWIQRSMGALRECMS